MFAGRGLSCRSGKFSGVDEALQFGFPNAAVGALIALAHVDHLQLAFSNELVNRGAVNTEAFSGFTDGEKLGPFVHGKKVVQRCDTCPVGDYLCA